MTALLRITAAEAVLPGVLKIAWNDGCEGIVDLRATIAQGEIFEPVRNPENFRGLQEVVWVICPRLEGRKRCG